MSYDNIRKIVQLICRMYVRLVLYVKRRYAGTGGNRYVSAPRASVHGRRGGRWGDKTIPWTRTYVRAIMLVIVTCLGGRDRTLGAESREQRDSLLASCFPWWLPGG